MADFRFLATLAVLVAALALFLALAPGAAANHVQCGDVITQDTTLDSDLVCAGNGLIVEAAGVTVNLGGRTIQGTGALGSGVMVWSYDGVAIRNGTIHGFSEGVYTDGARGTALRRMVLKANRTGLRCAYAPECRVEDSVLRHNTTAIEVGSADGGDPAPTIVQHNTIRHNGTGVSISGEAGIVADNRIQQNTGDGVRNDYGKPVRIAGNTITGNGDDGVDIFYFASATVSHNWIAGNAANGVHTRETNANVADNAIKRNGGDGVLVENVDSNVTVARNVTNRNGDDGIDVDFATACCSVTVVQDNRAFHNIDLGIEAAPGTTDGGGNRARKNGNPAQCVGVRCK